MQVLVSVWSVKFKKFYLGSVKYLVRPKWSFCLFFALTMLILAKIILFFFSADFFCKWKTWTTCYCYFVQIKIIVWTVICQYGAWLWILSSCSSMKKVDEETGKYYGRKAVSFVLKRQPWVWASTHWLYVYHEMHTRWILFQRWTAAFWEHRVEPLRWSFKLWPGWGILSS